MNEENRTQSIGRSIIPPPQGVEQARLQRSRAGQKGGERSARIQQRDAFGQFAGRVTHPHSEGSQVTMVRENQGPH